MLSVGEYPVDRRLRETRQDALERYKTRKSVEALAISSTGDAWPLATTALIAAAWVFRTWRVLALIEFKGQRSLDMSRQGRALSSASECGQPMGSASCTKMDSVQARRLSSIRFQR